MNLTWCGIHVQIRENDCEKFRDKLIEGSVYHLSRFQVTKATIQNLSTMRAFCIFFTSNTLLKLIPDDPTPYPRYYFQFLDRDKMASYANSDKYLIGKNSFFFSPFLKFYMIYNIL